MGSILIDGRALQDRSAVRGIGTYLRGLLAGFRALGLGDRIELLFSSGAPLPPELPGLGARAAAARVPRVLRRLQPVLDPFFVEAVLTRLKPDLYHGVEWAQPVGRKVPTVITVHDLIPFVMPTAYPWMRRERILALHQLRRADAVITDSHATAADVQRIARVADSRIHVVHLAVDPAFSPARAATVQQLRSRLGLQRPYLLATGTFDPRKRMQALAAVAATVVQHHDIDLVIAGDQGVYAAPLAATLRDAGVIDRSHILGFVPATDLVALYSGCACFVFTSGYEGFGLPPLEAMACGAPVVAFDNSSIPEVIGDGGFLVPDGDVSAMADVINALLADSARDEQIRARGRQRAAEFTWLRTAERTAAIYRDLLNR